MRDLIRLIVWAVGDLFRSRAAIEAEILTLQQQIIVLRLTAPKKQSFGAIDRSFHAGPGAFADSDRHCVKVFIMALHPEAAEAPGSTVRQLCRQAASRVPHRVFQALKARSRRCS